MIGKYKGRLEIYPQYGKDFRPIPGRYMAKLELLHGSVRNNGHLQLGIPLVEEGNRYHFCFNDSFYSVGKEKFLFESSRQKGLLLIVKKEAARKKTASEIQDRIKEEEGKPQKKRKYPIIVNSDFKAPINGVIGRKPGIRIVKNSGRVNNKHIGSI